MIQINDTLCREECDYTGILLLLRCRLYNIKFVIVSTMSMTGGWWWWWLKLQGSRRCGEARFVRVRSSISTLARFISADPEIILDSVSRARTSRASGLRRACACACACTRASRTSPRLFFAIFIAHTYDLWL